ncbi:hypothetical protein LX32DRAFT_639821 [Colletotrichum zoysiae]|uniref:Siderophore biosynthesis protein n=1 Tax=Colletotrichum zoysiae TaxID=1216348 RepID=A0AAD9HIE3_9PEZI|nr:hypothetical protein LX32DRAFT_639821 [Colletotrichum zoysiae]
MLRYLLPALATTAVLAKTDLEGCISFTSTVTVDPSPGYGNTYETFIWYVPDTLEICRGVDCGGGRAPPRKVPGCPAYSGTDTVTASFLSTNPAARPTATPAPLTTTTGWAPAGEENTRVNLVTPTFIKLTLTTPAPTVESTPTGQASGAQSGTGAALTTGVPAGAGPTARAGVAAVLGLAAAAVALA